jgi:hypothetical protein
VPAARALQRFGIVLLALIGKGIELIMKPVQPMDLLRKIRGMLDAK